MSSLDDANNYIGARFGPNYTAWLALSDDDKGRTLTSADDYIDSFAWKGTATGILNDNPTSRAWPRSGIDGVDSATVPDAVVKASFELAVLIMADPDLPQNLDQGSNISSMGAGPAQMSFFRPLSPANGTATVLPPIVHRLIGQWLAGAGTGLAGAVITGINGRSDFSSGCRICGTAFGVTGAPGCSCGGTRSVVWPV